MRLSFFWLAFLIALAFSSKPSSGQLPKADGEVTNFASKFLKAWKSNASEADLHPFLLRSDLRLNGLRPRWLLQIKEQPEFTSLAKIQELRVQLFSQDEPFGGTTEVCFACFLNDGRWRFAGFRIEENTKHDQSSTELLSKFALDRFSDREQQLNAIRERIRTLLTKRQWNPSSKQLEIDDLPFLITSRLPSQADADQIESNVAQAIRSIQQTDMPARFTEYWFVQFDKPSERNIIVQRSTEKWVVAGSFIAPPIAINPAAIMTGFDSAPDETRRLVARLFSHSQACDVTSQLADHRSDELKSLAAQAFMLRDTIDPTSTCLTQIVGKLQLSSDNVFRKLIHNAGQTQAPDFSRAAQNALVQIVDESKLEIPLMSLAKEKGLWKGLDSFIGVCSVESWVPRERTVIEFLSEISEPKKYVAKLADVIRNTRDLTSNDAIASLPLFGKNALAAFPVLIHRIGQEERLICDESELAKTILVLADLDNEKGAILVTEFTKHYFAHAWNQQLSILAWLKDAGPQAAVALPQLERMATQDKAEPGSIAVDGHIYREAQKTIAAIKSRR